MGSSKRYARHGDDAGLQRMREREPPPSTLPMQAYGPQEIVWPAEQTPVWVWVQWPHRPAQRIAGWVKGYNDRIVIVAIPGEGGGWQPVVWRNAVTLRRH